MKNYSYTIRTMAKSDLGAALDWAFHEGWNPGVHDAECFYVTDPKGYLLGLLDGIPISCISAVSYNRSFAFLGLYLVHPDFRGKGYGLKIWKKAMEKLDRITTIGLDGVVAQQENYKKSGFKFFSRNIRFHGKNQRYKFSAKDIVTISSIPFEKVLTYDRLHFPAPRPSFLRCFIKQSDHTALGIIHRDNLIGYGVIRKCTYGYKIGPLFAESPDIAETLFQALSNSIEENASIFLDVPEVNPHAVKIAKDHSMTPMFETARMYKGPEPHLHLQNIFGVTTFELG
ncbi:GNAT family N-acetyltransferase [Candidatus Gottesmanbacteria bacterium]|nr:GNAT family N-acetyltransferase [Candidatus Gottesmanbacteria bacterium]